MLQSLYSAVISHLGLVVNMNTGSTELHFSLKNRL